MMPKPHILLPKRLPERKPRVTFIAGLRCPDGIVMCSDSLESDGYNKKNVQKIFKHEIEGKWGIAFGCSGSTAACTNYSDRLLELLSLENFGENYDRRGTEKLIEATMAYMKKEYPNEGLDVIAGLWGCSPAETRLYKAQSNCQCISVEPDYACAGLDVSLARFLLDSILTPDATVFDVMYIAAFVTSIMKEKADGVGGPTQMLWHHTTGLRWAEAKKSEMAKIERGGFIQGKFKIADLEKNIRQFCWSRFPHEYRPASKDD